MNTNHTDEAIRDLYRRLEPRVHTDEFCRSLGVKLTSKQGRAVRRRTLRVAMVTCVALAFVVAAGVGIYEAISQPGRPQQALVISDGTMTAGEPAYTSAALLPNPYPTSGPTQSTPSPTHVPGDAGERPSGWAESLGKAILGLYPSSDWKVLRAVEVEGGIMDVFIGPASTTGPNTTTVELTGPSIRVQVSREESGQLPQEAVSIQYREFATEHGHGLIRPTYYYGDGSQGFVTWFVRTDKLLVQVSVKQASGDAAPSEAALDEAGTQKLVEYVASIIQTAELLVADGVWELRIDRFGGSEDAQEAFGFLPEDRYRPIGDSPTYHYHVVISAQGEQVSVRGTRAATQFVVNGKRTSTTDEQMWYDLTDAFAGGRFVVWRSGAGLQGELTLYGSGRPIVFSERGSLSMIRSTADGPPTTASTLLLDQAETARAQEALLTFFKAWKAKNVAAWKALMSESRQNDMNVGDWTFADLDHIDFGAVAAVPEAIDSYANSRGLDRDDVRCFRASVTFYYEPGVVGSNDSGEELPWLWWLVRDADGRWGVDGWGA